jgi:hypothetical protein
MDTKLRTQHKAASSPSLLLSRGGILQRKCACGGTPGPSGECEACRKNRDSVNATMHRMPGPRFGHDFGEVRLHSPEEGNPLASSVWNDQTRYGKVSRAGKKIKGSTLDRTPAAIASVRSPAERRIRSTDAGGMKGSASSITGARTKASSPVEPGGKEDKCPSQVVHVSNPRCRRKYGALAEYSYGDGVKNWWFKEEVHSGPRSCQWGDIGQKREAIPSPSGALYDDILNYNGPPRKVAPCSDITYQTVFMGPTKDDVEKCQYQNTQVIKVTATGNGKSGKVITSSAGISDECSWGKE